MKIYAKLVFGIYENRCQISIWALLDFVKILLYHNGLQRCRIVAGFKGVVQQRALEMSDRTRLQRCNVVTGFRDAALQRALEVLDHTELQRCRVAMGFRDTRLYRVLEVPCSNGLCKWCCVATGFVNGIVGPFWALPTRKIILGFLWRQCNFVAQFWQ